MPKSFCFAKIKNKRAIRQNGEIYRGKIEAKTKFNHKKNAEKQRKFAE